MATDFDEADRIAARIADEWTDMTKGGTLAEVLTVVDAYQQTRARVATLETERAKLLQFAECAIEDTGPWCVECEAACQSTDEDGCCVACGADIWHDENGDPDPRNAAFLAILDMRSLMVGDEAFAATQEGSNPDV